LNKMSALKEKYKKEIAPKLKEEFGIVNSMAVPKVTKIVINVGVGGLEKDKKALEAISKDLAKITGQKPQVRPAKVSVAGFNIRQGMPVGLRVTLRGKKMYSFLEKFFSVVLSRLRDFKGVPAKSFDQGGNYTLGLKEHIVFPEIDLASSAGARGLEISFVTNAGEAKKARRLLELLGMPFEKGETHG